MSDRPAVTGPIPGAPEPPARAPAPLATTPSQTVGPFFHIGLPWDDGPSVVADGTPGAIEIHGRVSDGAGAPVPDALIETWQADPDGRFDHPDDPRGTRTPPAGFRGFGRAACGADGRFSLRTVKPGPVPFLLPGQSTGAERRGGEAPAEQAPHLAVSVFARGLLKRLVTRWYFGDEGLRNARDPVLARVVPERRPTLVAEPEAPGPRVDGEPVVVRYRIDVRLQGPGETVFFDL